MKFKGKVIISDIDGTYTGSAEGVRRNNEAIEYFRSEGGLFTFATGRVEFSVTSVVPDFTDSLRHSVRAYRGWRIGGLTDWRICGLDD